MSKLLQSDQEIHDRDGLLATSDQEATQDSVGLGTSLGAIAAVGLAGNDGRAQLTFS